ncbi:MAG: isopenicillin N synthase family oxygenase, partial [Saprospiraceae bacterium]|nr:isopenicillin N synthase family oxygenase [Saprospiraceae bacterium]
MTNRSIPLVSLSDFTGGDPTARMAFVESLIQAFRDIGFVGVINHGIDPALIRKFYEVSAAFFALPEEQKRQYEIPGLAGQRGYTSFGREHAKHSEVPDLKEFFQFGQEVPDNHPDRAAYPDNVAVAEQADFLPTAIALFRAFEAAGRQLLRAIALGLNLDEAYFETHVQYGNSILRSIYYPPITREPASAIRAEQHEDINLITLLVGASAGGLEVLDHNEAWLPVVPQDDEIVINVGDMLQRLTNNFLKSTTHRVVNPPREEWHKP